MSKTWIPSKENINQHKNIKDFLIYLYSIYENNFILNKLYFNGKKVIVPDNKLDCSNIKSCGSEQYYSCNDGCCIFHGLPKKFNHLLTDANKEFREPGKFSFHRAIKIRWIKLFIDNYDKYPILFFDEEYNEYKPHPKNKRIIKTYYFWAKNYNYIVVLNEVKNGTLFLSTAIYIPCSSPQAYTYQEKYDNYLNKTLKKTPI